MNQGDLWHPPKGRHIFTAGQQVFQYLKPHFPFLLFPNLDAPATGGLLSVAVAPHPILPFGQTGIAFQVANGSNETILAYAFISAAYNQSRSYFTGPYRSSTLIGVPILPDSVAVLQFLQLVPDRHYFVKIRCLSAFNLPKRISHLYRLHQLSRTA